LAACHWGKIDELIKNGRCMSREWICPKFLNNLQFAKYGGNEMWGGGRTGSNETGRGQYLICCGDKKRTTTATTD
jgi:hypothetical protein